MDFLSTWIATPNMVLEGNPIAKRLGWKGGIPLNLALCFLFASWPMPAIIISTTSVLVAGRNFQAAWLMRSLGEQRYRDWHIAQLQETSRYSIALLLPSGRRSCSPRWVRPWFISPITIRIRYPWPLDSGSSDTPQRSCFSRCMPSCGCGRSSLREERARRSPNGDSKAPLFGPPGNAIDPWSAGSGWERE